MRRCVATVVCMLVIAYGSSARGATITVDDSGGADYTSIGEALAAAASGDTVLVADGTYTGSNN